MGGVYGARFEHVALSTRADLIASDLDLHFLAASRHHTIRTTATAIRSATDHAHCTVRGTELATGKLTAIGSVGMCLW